MAVITVCVGVFSGCRAAMHTAHTVKYRPLPYGTEGFCYREGCQLADDFVWSIRLRALADQQVIE